MLNFSPARFPDWWQLPLWWFGFAAISLVLTQITMFVSKKDTRGEFAINLFYQNGLFFPLIVMSGVFGIDSSYLPQLYIFIVLHPIMFFSTYPLFFRKRMGEGERTMQWNRIFNPVLFATVLAIIVQLFGVRDYLPDFVQSILQILGGMALPLIMIILGGSLYLDIQQKGTFYSLEIIKFVVIKNVVFPLAVLGILILLKSYFNITYSVTLLFILQAAVPPITATPILTERAGGNKSISNQFVFSSFIFSVISIPLVFQLFSHFFPMP
jgi:predicted permease